MGLPGSPALDGALRLREPELGTAGLPANGRRAPSRLATGRTLHRSNVTSRRHFRAVAVFSRTELLQLSIGFSCQASRDPVV